MAVKSVKTTLAGAGLGTAFLVLLVDQINLLRDSDPETGDWLVVAALALAVIASVLHGVFSRDDDVTSERTRTES